MMKQKLALLLTALLLLTGAPPAEAGTRRTGRTMESWRPSTWCWTGIPTPSMLSSTRRRRRATFAEEGLQVNILFPSNASDPLTMTAAGRADIGFYYQGGLHHRQGQ